jgi:hypothetical protein
MALIDVNKIPLRLLVIVTVLTTSQYLYSQNPQIEYCGGKVWVKNLNEDLLHFFKRYHHDQADLQEVFPIQTKQSIDGISVSGRYEIFTSSICFTPRFAFANGVDYVANFHAELLAKNPNEVYLPAMDPTMLTLEFFVKGQTQSQAAVVNVYPSVNILPENLLRFHIEFSTPMTHGEVYNRVKLFDANHQEVEKAFLVVDQELWDEEMKIVTILLDPGRIKQGLRSNLEMGAPLQAGQKYTLVIDADWKDGFGYPFKSSYKKEFTTTHADRTSPSIAELILIPPASPSDSLILYSNEAFDKLQLENSFMVFDAQNNQLECSLTINNSQTEIKIKPSDSWTNQTYRVKINPLLEDLAGNNFLKPFDRDVTLTVNQEHIKNELTFSPDFKFSGSQKNNLEF